FYTESREMLDALSTVNFEIPDAQWDAMADRMRVRIHEDYADRQPFWRRSFYLPAFAGAVAILLFVVALHRTSSDLQTGRLMPNTAVVPVVSNTDVALEPTVDPVTAEFLEESELLLRTVMKLKATSSEDLEDARRIARRQLVGLDQRKQAVSEVKPLVSVMN